MLRTLPPLLTLFGLLLATTILGQDVAFAHWIHWKRSSLVLIKKGATYARMIRLKNGSLLCAYEMRGESWVKRSVDDGKTWGRGVLVASSPYGSDSNPFPIQLQNGSIQLWYNFRPSDGVHPYEIGYDISHDGGATWKTGKTVWVAGVTSRTGCWEPASIQLPSGEIEVFFSMEAPFGKIGEQGIALCRSKNNGSQWTKPEIISCNPGRRDGMPIPMISTVTGRIYVSIEANRSISNQLQPAIIWTSLKDDWNSGCIGKDSSYRLARVIHPILPASSYAGAPYLCDLNPSTFILSCQLTDNNKRKPCMMVYMSDSIDMRFASPSEPFGAGEDTGCWWNALFPKNEDTITAISHTSVNGVVGIWAIDGILK